MIMKRILLIVIVLAGFVHHSFGQVSAAFLQDEIYQNNAVNPAYFPNAKWFIGLPVLSGTALNYNNRLGYSDVITQLDNGVNLVDFEKTLGSLKKNNHIGVNFRVSDLFIGYRSNQAALSFFINDRIDVDLFFPKDLIDFGLNGNAAFIGETLELGKLGLNASHYREFGFGYTYFDKEDRFSFGYRIKLLNGFYNVSIPTSFTGNLTTNSENFALGIEVENAILRSTQVPENGTFIFSSNVGAAVDLGINYHYNEQFSIGFSLTDIGFISWKDSVNSRQLEDLTFTYGGVDVRNTDDLVQALEDSLADKFNLVEDIADSYSTMLPLQGNLTGSWNITGNSQLVVSIAPRYVLGYLQMRYGAGITHKVGKNLKLNVSVNKLPQQAVNLGAALSAYLGPIQIYGGTDKTIGYNLTTLRNFNYTFGINLAFGRGKVKKTKEYSPQKFRINGGEEIPVRGKEKIYLIIKKQKRKKPVNETKKVKEGVFKNE